MEATNLKITSLFLNGSECNNRCFACFYIQNVTRDCQELSRMIEMVSQTKNFDIIAVLPDTEHNTMQLTRGTATLDRLMSLNKPWELMVIPKDLYLLEPADQMPCYDLRKFHAIVRNGGDPCDYIRMRNFIQTVETDYVKRKLGTGDCNESLLFGLERRDYPTSWFYPENGMHYAMTGILIETPDKEKFRGFVIDVPAKESLSFHKNFSLPGYICAWMFEKDPIINIDFHDYDFQPSKLQGDLSTFINGKPVIVSEGIVKHVSYKEPEIEIPYTNWEKDVKHPVDFEDFAENARSYEEDVSSYSQGAPEEKRMVKEDIITPFKEKVKEYEQEERDRTSSMTPLLITPIRETHFHAFVINVQYEDVVPFVEDSKLPGYICGYLHIAPSYVFIDFNSYKHDLPCVITAGDTMYQVYPWLCQPVLVSDNIIPHLNPSEPVIRLDKQMWKEEDKLKLTYGEWVDALQKDLREYEEHNKTVPDCAKIQTEYIGGPFKEKIKELKNQEVNEPEKEASEMSDEKLEESTPESIKDRFEYGINLFVEYLKQDVRNSIKCEPIQQCMIRLIDMKHQEFLKDSEKIVVDHIQLYKDITTENPDKQINEIITDLEGAGSTVEDFKKWIREVFVEYLEIERKEATTRHMEDDLKQSYDDDASELDIANVKEDTEMANKIKINTAVLTTFPLINCCGGKLCYTKDENLFWVLEMNSFGNPEDKCWKLILELGLPVFYQNSHEKESRDTAYTRITNPVDPKWYCSPNTGKLGFYPDGINPVIANFSHIGVLLTNPFDQTTECRVAYGAHKRPIYTEDAIRAAIDCICEHYGRVPKELVNAIVNYYKED